MASTSSCSADLSIGVLAEECNSDTPTKVVAFSNFVSLDNS